MLDVGAGTILSLPIDRLGLLVLVDLQGQWNERNYLLQLQQDNGLDRTAALDQQTADVLLGHTGVGQVSGIPPKGAGGG